MKLTLRDITVQVLPMNPVATKGCQPSPRTGLAIFFLEIILPKSCPEYPTICTESSDNDQLDHSKGTQVILEAGED